MINKQCITIYLESRRARDKKAFYQGMGTILLLFNPTLRGRGPVPTGQDKIFGVFNRLLKNHFLFGLSFWNYFK